MRSVYKLQFKGIWPKLQLYMTYHIYTEFYKQGTKRMAQIAKNTTNLLLVKEKGMLQTKFLIKLIHNPGTRNKFLYL